MLLCSSPWRTARPGGCRGQSAWATTQPVRRKTHRIWDEGGRRAKILSHFKASGLIHAALSFLFIVRWWPLVAAVITTGAKEEVRYDKVALYTTYKYVSWAKYAAALESLTYLSFLFMYKVVLYMCECVNVYVKKKNKIFWRSTHYFCSVSAV